MAVDVIMPQMGESTFEGTITRWLKKAGDRVERDEPLFEISTDKVDAEIPAPSAGVLKEIKVNEGQTVPIQTVVAVIDAAGSAAAVAPAAPAAAPAAERPPLRWLPRARCSGGPLACTSDAGRPECHASRARRAAATARRFAALRWSANSPRNITSIWPRWRAAAPADASASGIFLTLWRRAAQSPPLQRRRSPRPCHPLRRKLLPRRTFWSRRSARASRAGECRAARADLFRQV